MTLVVSRRMSPREHLCVLVALAAACVAAFAFVRISVIDDAFITYRYSWNLVHGNGLVFNRGERVEGFSNPTWTLICTIPILLGWPPDIFGSLLGTALAVGALWLVYRTARERLGLSPLPVCAAFGVAVVSPTFWRVMGNGLEAGLYSLLLAALAWYVLAGRLRAAGIVCALLAWTRPEAALFLLGIVAVELFSGTSAMDSVGSPRHLRGKWPSRSTWRSVLGAIWPGAAGIALLFVLRFAYYHELLPNTVIAKMPPAWATWLQAWSGLQYIGFFALPHLVLVCAAVVGYWRAIRRTEAGLRPGFAVMGLILLLQVAVILRSGGDWDVNPRFLLPFVPFLVLFATYAFDSARRYKRLGPGLAQAALAVGVSWLLSWNIMPRALYGTFPREWVIKSKPRLDLAGTLTSETYSYSPLADKLLDPDPILRPDDKICAESLGLFCYKFLDHYSFDILGLTDTTVSHTAAPLPDGRTKHLWVQCMGRSNPVYTAHAGVSLFVLQSDLYFITPMRDAAGHNWFDAHYEVLRVKGISQLPPLILVVRRDRESIVTGLRARAVTLDPVSFSND